MKVILLVIALALSPLYAFPEAPSGTMPPQRISVGGAGGIVLPANVKNNRDRSAAYGAWSLKYAIHSRGNRPQDRLMGMPYWGIGVWVPYFSKDYFDRPFSVFLLQGARLAQITPVFSLDYEVNLGVSFGWRHFDRLYRPDYFALGSQVNVHLAGNVHFRWWVSRHVDLRAGLGYNHFSNGAARTPNNGVNALSAFVEVGYLLFPAGERISNSPLPAFERHWVHDVSARVGLRTLKLEGHDLDRTFDAYPRRRFAVAGINYSAMWRVTRRFMFGPSLELVYDQSSRSTFTSGVEDERYWERVALGSARDRFSAGLSLKAELAMPGFSVFANLGYDVLTRNGRDNRFYQIYGMKIHLCRNLFTSLGVRSTNFSWSRYLFVGVGYSFGKR